MPITVVQSSQKGKNQKAILIDIKDIHHQSSDDHH